jgi:hypothetical protein
MVTSQVDALQKELAEFPQENKENIVVSYLKNHSINTDWISSNPKLTDKMTSGSLDVSQIEAYFDCCKGNTIFRNDFENFIRLQFRKATFE